MADNQEPGRIVVGVDNSLAGLAALRFAVTQARERGTPLHAVRTWVAPHWRDHAALRWRMEIAHEAYLVLADAFSAATGGPPPDVAVEGVILDGFAGKVLTTYARGDTDLLVLGGRRHRRWRRTHGPVTRYCLRHATCPVVAVPAPLAGEPRQRRWARHLERDLRQFG